MILSRKDILKLIEEKKLAIIPFTKSNIGPASIDLTLSDEFRTFGKQKRITLAESTDYKKYSKKIKTNQITLLPGGFLLVSRGKGFLFLQTYAALSPAAHVSRGSALLFTSLLLLSSQELITSRYWE